MPERRAFRVRAALNRLGAVATGVLSAAVLAEIVLRVLLAHLPPKFGAYLTNCYDPGDGVNGIFYMDPRLGLTLPRPDFSTICSWNGFTWRHHGDRTGFRNSEIPAAVDVALLGDSIVYGHGVDEPETIAGQLRRRHNIAAYNLGLTGASPAHYLAFARNYALPAHPKAVVVVVFANDLVDIPLQRSSKEIEAFSRDRIGREMRILPADSLAQFAPRPSPLMSALERSWFLRSFGYARRALTKSLSPALAAASPNANGQEAEFGGRFAPAVAYMKTALAILAHDSRRVESRLIVLYVPAVQGAFAAENNALPGILSAAAAQDGYAFADATDTLMDGPEREKPGTRLAADGHLSGGGAALVADLIASHFHEPAPVYAPLGVPLGIDSPWVRLINFWDAERDARGAYAWSKADSAIEISGLRVGVPVAVSLRFRHAGSAAPVGVTMPGEPPVEFGVSADETKLLPAPLRADANGNLLLRLTTRPFRPSDRGHSSDQRELGVSLSGVAVDLER